MGVGTIISACLFILPAAITTGVLVGWDAVRSSGNQKPIFTVPPGGGYGGGPGIGPPATTAIETDMYCDKSVGISPYVAKGYQQYVLNPNQWGWTEGTAGALCMSVTEYENGTYPSKVTAPGWSVTWQYPQGPVTQPVHAFPNIKLNADDNTDIPLQLNAVTKVEVSVEWAYGVGDSIPTSIDTAGLTTAEANMNVAFDMFLDDDKSKSTDPNTAKFEVMVWLAAFGTATQPIGYPTVRATQVVNGVTLNLYYGTNGQDQTVMTWMVPSGTVVPSFSGDLTPLITYDYSSIAGLSAIAEPPSSTAYLGYIGLGSEAYWSAQNVTLSVPKMDIFVSK